MTDNKWIYESAMAKMEIANKRQFITILILVAVICFLAGTLFYYVTQYTVEETTMIEAEQQADGDSNNYVIGGDYGGETKSDGDEN